MKARYRLYLLSGFSAFAAIFFSRPRRSRKRDITIDAAAWWDRRLAIQRGDGE
jgi:hypothetical protein